MFRTRELFSVPVACIARALFSRGALHPRRRIGTLPIDSSPRASRWHHWGGGVVADYLPYGVNARRPTGFPLEAATATGTPARDGGGDDWRVPHAHTCVAVAPTAAPRRNLSIAHRSPQLNRRLQPPAAPWWDAAAIRRAGTIRNVYRLVVSPLPVVLVPVCPLCVVTAVR